MPQARPSKTRTKKLRPQPQPGTLSRQTAHKILEDILYNKCPLDRALDRARDLDHLSPSDRGHVRLIVTITLRRKGQLSHLLGRYMRKALPGRARLGEIALLAGAAELLFLNAKPYAAVNTTTRIFSQNPNLVPYKSLANAVLRNIAKDHDLLSLDLDHPEALALNIPSWLMKSWQRDYGPETAQAITKASLEIPPLDLSVKTDPEEWAGKLGAALLPAGIIRLTAHKGPITALEGFNEGAWWVQDAAASLPVHLLGDINGKSVADLCAAPGGKTAQLCNNGAHVTAIDRSPTRLQQLQQNLTRLNLTATLIEADLLTRPPPQQFDAVLLDAPCSATGSLRRHPDLLHLKDETMFAELTERQQRLLTAAWAMLAPGGIMVYATCSLDSREGEQQIEAFLKNHPDASRIPLHPDQLFGLDHMINEKGDLRTLPCHSWGEHKGGDGFYAARVQKSR